MVKRGIPDDQLCKDHPCTCGAVVHSPAFLWDFAQALLRARARRRARLAIENPEALARELAREAAKKRGETQTPPDGENHSENP